MSHRTRAIALGFVAGTATAAAAFAQSPAQPADANLPVRSRYLPEYTASGELILPKGVP